MNSFSFPYLLHSKQVNQSLYRPSASSDMNIMQSIQHEKQMLLHLLKHLQLMLLHWSYKVTPMEQDKITQYGLEHWSKIGIINKNVEIRDLRDTAHRGIVNLPVRLDQSSCS